MYISNGHFVYRNTKKEQSLQYRNINNSFSLKKKKKDPLNVHYIIKIVSTCCSPSYFITIFLMSRDTLQIH